MSKFSHLHVHSHYSLLNALPKIPELIAAAKKNDMNAFALTDNGNLYGAIEFYKECKSADIKPILGIDAYMAVRKRTDKEPRIDNKRSRLILLAKNYEGYLNLIKLVTISHLDGFYYKPRLDKELLEQYKDNLICISPSFSGEISQALKSNNHGLAKELADYYKKLFPDDFYLELTHHPEIEGQMELKEKIIAFAKKENIPLVAAHDVYYVNKDDRRARETLMSIQSSFDGAREEKNSTDDFSFISDKDAQKYFKDTKDAIENIQKIIDKCNLELELGKWVFPDFKVESGRTADDELRHVVYEGVKEKNIEVTDEIKTRIEYELKVIKDKGYGPYFLVVSDLLKYARENGILSTIRGSVAGSIVTYLAGITKVNPIEYKLPFERFLNPERPSAPDIDMDYADNRRDEMLAYARRKYGNDKVAQIGTFGTMMARGSVRDVARALGYPYSSGDNIAKLIPMGAQGFPMTIDRALKEVSELKKLYDEDEDTREIVDMAKKIEGCARHISVHAAGVVIAPRPLTDFCALQYDTKGEDKIITQYDMHAVEDAGLLKFDFLGIRNLAILADAVKRVERIENIKIDIENIPLNDPKTFEMLAKGETIGLFQLNGSGMTRFLKELKPTTIHDINAMVALYRPGPMEMIPDYIQRKHNPALVTYLDPRMKEILSQSYGVITYQDDVLLISIHLAGYSWLEADKLRKAMGKKIPAVMQAEKEKLSEGLLKNGMTKEKAEQLWKLIEPFAAYGFNKAHAASYGRVAYQTSYMKANFPAIYMASVLTAESGDVEKIAEIITECKRMKIPVLPPDINESFSDFGTIKGKDGESDSIRFGLTTIKNFGSGISSSITEERKKNGHFKSLEDFLNRITDKNLNKKSLEALIKCGALDAFGERGMMLANMEDLLLYNKEKNRGPKDHDSLFGDDTANLLPPLRLKEALAAEPADMLAWEKELLGLYVSGHPLDKHREKLEARNTDIAKAKETMRDNQTGVICGIVEEIKEFVTKKGDKMCFIKITDMSGSMEVVAFPKVCVEFKDHLTIEKCVAIKGRFSMRNGNPSFIAEAVKALV